MPKFTLKYPCCAVTSWITSFLPFERFGNSIQANWKEPVHHPFKLVITVTCKYGCINGQIYLVRKNVLPPNQTSVTFTGLVPGSECDFTLKAVYNPASIDSGISVTYMILPASKTLPFVHLFNILEILKY